MANDKPIPFEIAQRALDDAKDQDVRSLQNKLEILEKKLTGIEQRNKAAHDYLSVVMPRLHSILTLIEK